MKLPFLLVLLFFNSTMLLPNSFDELISKGDSLYAQSDMQYALDYYEQAYRIDSSDYYLLLKITRVCNDLGEYYYELHDEELSEKVVFAEEGFAFSFSLLLLSLSLPLFIFFVSFRKTLRV
jgi:tetratricopeptide (TPR) repeat protein